MPAPQILVLEDDPYLGPLLVDWYHRIWPQARIRLFDDPYLALAALQSGLRQEADFRPDLISTDFHLSQQRPSPNGEEFAHLVADLYTLHQRQLPPLVLLSSIPSAGDRSRPDPFRWRIDKSDLTGAEGNVWRLRLQEETLPETLKTRVPVPAG